MSVDVDKTIAEVIRREGGYSNNPNDKGGETNYGITKLQARAYGYNGDMKTLPIVTAQQIYKSIYWYNPKFDAVATYSVKIAEELFDTGVNMGPQRSARMLQRALNTLNRGGKDFADIAVDGQLGPMSLYVLGAFLKLRGLANAEKVLLRLLEAQQAVRYMEIAEANASQEEFMYGWVLNRVGDI